MLNRKILILSIALLFLGSGVFTYCFDIDLTTSKAPDGIKISSQSWAGAYDNKKKYRVGIVVQKVTLGEREVAQRYKIAIENLGWEAYVFKYKAKLGRYKITAWAVNIINNILNYYFKPDFLVIFYPSYYPVLTKGVPKYLVVLADITETLKSISSEQSNEFISDFQYIGDYDGYIDINHSSGWTSQIDTGKFSRNPDNNTNKIIVHGYPTTYATAYKAPDYKRLFYCGGNWDNLRSSEKYKEIIKSLEQKGYLDVFGPKTSWEYLGPAYKGFIPNDGHSLIQKIRENGIALILHSDIHNSSGLPSARIFEAAAAGSVIISDPHPFIKKEFGSCVLYIDTLQPAQKVIEEIDDYVKWIKSHPVEAEVKARCAHKIFTDKYTLEELIFKLATAHSLFLHTSLKK